MPHRTAGCEPTRACRRRRRALRPCRDDGRGDRDDASPARPPRDPASRRERSACRARGSRPVPSTCPRTALRPYTWNSGSTPKHDVVGGDRRRFGRGCLLDVGEQRAVAQHRRARAPRGAGCVEEHGEGFRIARRHHRGWARRRGRRTSSRPVELRHPNTITTGTTAPAVASSAGACSASAIPPTALRMLRQRRFVGKARTGAGVGEHARELPGGEGRIERDGDHPGAQDSEVRRDELDTVDHARSPPGDRRSAPAWRARRPLDVPPRRALPR